MGIDSSGEIGAVGLANEDGIIGELNLQLSNPHSEELLNNIDFLLKQTGYSLKDLDGISITNGPGSFTGLRIGLSTARTFAQVLDIPLIGISCLDVLAYNTACSEEWIVPVIDARRGRVYTAVYQGWARDIMSRKLSPDRAVEIDILLEELKSRDHQGAFIFVGNGSTIYQEIIKNSGLNVRTVSKDRNIIHGGVIAELGYYYLERGKGANYLEVLPNYLKKAQAEINWLKNNG
jgi:tRNA threonylcarbamoyladenosine biosynthesis protein TsaB